MTRPINSSLSVCMQNATTPEILIPQTLLHFTGARLAKISTVRGLAVVILEYRWTVFFGLSRIRSQT